ncbi:MAG: hypothetical protein ACI861_002635 [Paracoccaceae bacterium]|jgi:hypothetical protein
MLPPVVKSITVPCSKERAFELFTRDIATWWPLDKHSVSAMSGKVARDIKVDWAKGGEVWEIDHAGEKVLWGSVAEFTPSSGVALNWHINGPADQATLVEVAFAANGEGCDVVLTHSRWEAHGEQGENMRSGYNGGWVHVFEECFQTACG